MRVTLTLICLLLTCMALHPGPAEAADPAEQAESAEDRPQTDVAQSTPDKVPALAPVTVFGRPEDTLTGVHSFDRQILDRLPARNDSLNEAISIMPGVQMPEQGRSSLTAGEIVPPVLSISGGKESQNTFLIDGIGNNSLLDPSKDDPTSITTVPDHPQALFLDTDLVEEINVYRYNVPARYGRFTGGVVDVGTRSPEPVFFGELSYRTTRSAWTKFHLDRDISDSFADSNRTGQQPAFEKHLGGLLLNTPLSDRVRLLTSYQVTLSDIPLQHLGETRSQTRKNENLLFKLAWDIDALAELEATLQYAPYEGEYFYPDSRDSDFTIEGGGSVASLGYDRTLDFGELAVNAAWKSSESSRDAPPDLRPWLVSPDKPWGEVAGSTIGSTPVSFEGGVGSLETWQEGFEVNLGVSDLLYQAGEVVHQLAAGIGFEQATGHFERDRATSSYYTAVADENVVCPEGATDCITGQQYFNKRLYFAADTIDATINLWDAYLEDKITWRNLEVRPGVHLSHDDFMENTTLSPRFAVSYDLFGDDSSLLFGGINRYYGPTLLTYKLREASRPYQTELRDADNLVWTPQDPFVFAPTGFVNDRKGRPFVYSTLDTPYSDETVVGLNQRLLGGQLVLAWVHREGRDEFTNESFEAPAVLEDGTVYFKDSYRLTNNGRSTHDEYSLEWERAWQKHYLAVNLTYQETETNNNTYLDTVSLEDLGDIIWYEGSYIQRHELPREDFNRPWTLNLIYSVLLPHNLVFTNTARYQSGYEGLDQLGRSEKTALGLPTSIVAYRKQKLSDSWIFDWQLAWGTRLPNDHRLTLRLEVDNVFNQRAEIGDPTRILTYQTYQTGRQYWAGLDYSF